jgi:hypothetical protein
MKEAVAVSQGNCSSAIIKSGSTEGGLKKWLTFATAVNCWRNNRKLLEAYIDRSEEALRFVCEKSGVGAVWAEWRTNMRIRGVPLEESVQIEAWRRAFKIALEMPLPLPSSSAGAVTAASDAPPSVTGQVAAAREDLARLQI